MSPFSKLESFPSDVLTQIAFLLVEASFFGPPAGLVNLLLVSTSIWDALSLKNNRHLYAQIFRLKFDVPAAVRRIGGDCEYSRVLAAELVKRCVGLKRLKGGAYPDDDDYYLRVDLWMAYLMFMESDGKNAKQLIRYANVDLLTFRFIEAKGKFHRGRIANGGWVVNNDVNALIAWLFWFTDKDRFIWEDWENRKRVLRAFACVYFDSFTYPYTYAPKSPALRLHLRPSLPYHFGLKIAIACPILAEAVLLSCAVRYEACKNIKVLTQPYRTKRLEAPAIGLTGASTKQHKEYHVFQTIHLDWDEDGKANSKSHDRDWARLRMCYDLLKYPSMRYRVFTPGMLHGSWVGTMFNNTYSDFGPILYAVTELERLWKYQVPDVSPTPIQFEICENHQVDPKAGVTFDPMRPNEAFFPRNTIVTPLQGGAEIYDPEQKKRFIYPTYDASRAARAALDEEVSCEHGGLYENIIQDTILTAETVPIDNHVSGREGQYFFGRVREYDGLVVLVRAAYYLDDAQRSDISVFRGYIHGGRTIVGRFLDMGTPTTGPAERWDGVLCMTKMGD